ncbi:sir antagonist [Schizosaccharomyces japonicus yFS275]|uniref:Sir antagonist n=1 Tax=Schizosaccharomyces japonicus (strain yFS275 / FY16936) TaxID=402676 RepID=B6JVY7_SCHJY|nr:sir antagonist [Schizosaccharomyces japonicus yFS275]EEB05538.1 sir antagonist [Schizosaccharomyces japonicus yFS275]
MSDRPPVNSEGQGTPPPSDQSSQQQDGQQGATAGTPAGPLTFSFQTVLIILNGEGDGRPEDGFFPSFHPPIKRVAKETWDSFEKVAPEDLEDKTCPICYDEMGTGAEDGENAIRMPCNHVFGDKCLKQWLDTHDTCPLCRQTVPSESVQGSPAPMVILIPHRREEEHVNVADGAAADANAAAGQGESLFTAPPPTLTFPPTGEVPQGAAAAATDGAAPTGNTDAEGDAQRPRSVLRFIFASPLQPTVTGGAGLLPLAFANQTPVAGNEQQTEQGVGAEGGQPQQHPNPLDTMLDFVSLLNNRGNAGQDGETNAAAAAAAPQETAAPTDSNEQPQTAMSNESPAVPRFTATTHIRLPLFPGTGTFPQMERPLNADAPMAEANTAAAPGNGAATETAANAQTPANPSPVEFIHIRFLPIPHPAAENETNSPTTAGAATGAETVETVNESNTSSSSSSESASSTQNPTTNGSAAAPEANPAQQQTAAGHTAATVGDWTRFLFSRILPSPVPSAFSRPATAQPAPTILPQPSMRIVFPRMLPSMHSPVDAAASAAAQNAVSAAAGQPNTTTQSSPSQSVDGQQSPAPASANEQRPATQPLPPHSVLTPIISQAIRVALRQFQLRNALRAAEERVAQIAQQTRASSTSTNAPSPDVPTASAASGMQLDTSPPAAATTVAAPVPVIAQPQAPAAPVAQVEAQAHVVSGLEETADSPAVSLQSRSTVPSQDSVPQSAVSSRSATPSQRRSTRHHPYARSSSTHVRCQLMDRGACNPNDEVVRFQCGHYVHRGCLSSANPSSNETDMDEDVTQCPDCRSSPTNH